MFITEKYYPLNAFRICVDMIDKDVAGRAYSPLQADYISFRGMGELLVRIDEVFDRAGYPQAFQDKRSFDKDKLRLNLYHGIPIGELTVSDIVGRFGEIRTFDVVVNSRKNTSWQGRVYNEDRILLGEFNGEIELLAIIIKNSEMV